MEPRMLTAILVTAVVGLGAGATGGAVLTRRAMEAKVEAAESRADVAEEQADARVAEANAAAMDAAGKNTTGALDAALAVDNKDANTRAEVAAMPATQLAVVASLKPDAPPWVLAIAGYSMCISGAQGKQEGSAAFDCGKRGERLDEAIAARIADLALEQRAEALDDREASLDAVGRGLADRSAALDEQEREALQRGHAETPPTP